MTTPGQKLGAAIRHNYACLPNSMLEVMDIVADWADLRSVDYGLYRDGDKWTLRIMMSDARGPFSAYYELPMVCTRADFMRNRLDRLCMEKRKERMPVVRFAR